MLKPMTDEQRLQATQDRLSAQEYARNNLKTSYADEPYWREQCSKYNIRMPGWWIPSSEVKYLRRAAKKLGVSLDGYVESTGFTNIKQFVAANDKFTALAMVGLLTEWHVENQSAESL